MSIYNNFISRQEGQGSKEGDGLIDKLPDDSTLDDLQNITVSKLSMALRHRIGTTDSSDLVGHYRGNLAAQLLIISSRGDSMNPDFENTGYESPSYLGRDTPER